MTRPIPFLVVWTLVLGSPVHVAASPHAGLKEIEGELHRATPRQTTALFIEACRSGDYDRAAYALDLRAIDRSARAERGPALARRLKLVLDQSLWLDFDHISDDPEGDPSDGARREELGTLRVGELEAPLELVRVSSSGSPMWLVAQSTLAKVDVLYGALGPALALERLPRWMIQTRIGEVAVWQWLGILLAFVAAWLLGVVVTSLVLYGAGKVASRTRVEWDDRLLAAVRGPSRAFFTLLAFAAALPLLSLAVPAQQAAYKIVRVAIIGALVWQGVRLVGFLAQTAERKAVRVVEEQGDELRARAVRTQALVLKRVADVVVLIVGGAFMLLQFDVVRSIGVSLLASAGMAGIVLGLAAQRSLSALLAGIQLSITQPIRIGDTVIVENEWGWIEEINLTYVVVRVWDQRRLVVPINRFLDQPFQNWTKVAPELLGTIYFHADYALPIDAVRAELERILEDNPRWDGRAKGVVVTDVTERTLQVRALVSAKDAGTAWDLRCEVREKLIAWLRSYENGRYLPRGRVEAADPRMLQADAG